MLVGVLHGLAHGTKRLEALPDGYPALPAVLGQREAIDIFHDEPRGSVGEGIRVVEPRDGWMIQLRERALLAEEAFAPGGREPGVTQDLDGDQTAEIVALGEVHHAHAALAEHAPDVIRAEVLGGACRRPAPAEPPRRVRNRRHPVPRARRENGDACRRRRRAAARAAATWPAPGRV